MLLGLAAVSYGLKAVGPVLAGGRQLGPGVRRALDLAAVPLLAALILTQTVGDGHRLVLDARLPALPSRPCWSGGGRRSWSSCWRRRAPRPCSAPSRRARAAPVGPRPGVALGHPGGCPRPRGRALREAVDGRVRGVPPGRPYPYRLP